MPNAIIMHAIVQTFFGTWHVSKTTILGDKVAIDTLSGPYDTPEEACTHLPKEARKGENHG